MKKRIIALLLVLSMLMGLAGCSGGTEKAAITVTNHDLDVIDGAIFEWKKVKGAENYRIYRGELGEVTAETEVARIAASGNSAYSYKSGIFGADNLTGFGYGMHDAYQIKAFKTVGGEEKVIAESEVYRLYDEFGENGSVLNYIDYAKKAIDTTQKAMRTLGVDKMGAYGKGLDEFLGKLSKGIGLTGTILNLFGLGGQSEPSLTEKMYAEIQEMHAELIEVSNKLDNVTEAVHKVSENMNQFRAETEFRDLSDRSEKLYSEWISFEQTYMEEGMDDLLDQYNWLMRDGIEEWCKNKTSSAREAYDVDNTKIMLIFDPETDELLYTRENELPEEAAAYPYVILKAACLPETMKTWTIDTYSDTLSNVIRGNLETALSGGDEAALEAVIETGSFPELTVSGWKELNDEQKDALLERICALANDELLYRISVAKVNENPTFVREVIVCFKNYCTNLIRERGTGIDAFLQSMYLTACFEGEIKDDYRSFCTNMMAQTCEYAMFALDVVGKSDKTTKSETDTASDVNVIGVKWNKAIESLNAALENGLTGYDDYCYLVGARVDALPVTATLCYSTYSYETTSRFEELSVTPRIKYQGDVSSMIIDKNDALVLNMLFLAKHSSSYLEFLRKYLTSAASVNETDRYLASWNASPVGLSESDKALVVAAGYYGNVIGQTYAQIMARSANHFLSQKMEGDLIDTSTAMLSENNTLGVVHVFKEGKDYDCIRTAVWPDGGSTARDMTPRAYRWSDNDYLFTLVALKAAPAALTAGSTLQSVAECGASYNPLDCFN